MGFYSDRILPHLIKFTMRDRRFDPYRQRAISTARGRVAEIGIGAGENLGRYGTGVSEVIGIEPSERLAAMAQRAATRAALPVTVVRAFAEHIPLDERSIDTVVMTWTLCSIEKPTVALHEIRRILKPDGQLLFVEHGLAPEPNIRSWQHRLTPLWRRVAGGCHLDRDMAAMITGAGFRLHRLETGYAPGPRPMSFMYEGTAVPRPDEGG